MTFDADLGAYLDLLIDAEPASRVVRLDWSDGTVTYHERDSAALALAFVRNVIEAFGEQVVAHGIYKSAASAREGSAVAA